MQTEKDYRPSNIEFNFDKTKQDIMPDSLGNYETAEESALFLSDNKIIGINQQLNAIRMMDNVEKTIKREIYNELMEDQLPRFEKKHSHCAVELVESKENEKQAKEQVNATLTEAKTLAYEVKRGIVSMNLDDKYTSRIAFKGRYYFYTWIDGVLKLADIKEIPEREKGEIFNQMAGNEEFFNTNFGNE